MKFSNPPDCQELLAGAVISAAFTLEQTNFHKVQQPCLCSQQPQDAEMNPPGCGEPATVPKGSRQSSLCSSRQGEKVQDGHKASSQPVCRPARVPLPGTLAGCLNTSLLLLGAAALQPALTRGKLHFQITLFFYHLLRNSILKYFFPKRDLHGLFTCPAQWAFPVD